MKVDAPQGMDLAVELRRAVARIAAADVCTDRAPMPVAIVGVVAEAVQLGRSRTGLQVVTPGVCIGPDGERRAAGPAADHTRGEPILVHPIVTGIRSQELPEHA